MAALAAREVSTETIVADIARKRKARIKRIAASIARYDGILRNNLSAERRAAVIDNRGYWVKILSDLTTTEQEMNRRNEAPMAAPPSPGWRLIAKRRFQNATHVFDAGCSVEPAQLGKNFASMLTGHYVAWVPPNDATFKAPRDLPPPAPPQKPNPKVEIVHHDDVLESWRRTWRAMAEKCGGDAARAKDLLMAHDRGSELFRRATAVWVDREAARLGQISVSAPMGAF
jgi:hypothetical protein